MSPSNALSPWMKHEILDLSFVQLMGLPVLRPIYIYRSLFTYMYHGSIASQLSFFSFYLLCLLILRRIARLSLSCCTFNVLSFVSLYAMHNALQCHGYVCWNLMFQRGGFYFGQIYFSAYSELNPFSKHGNCNVDVVYQAGQVLR